MSIETPSAIGGDVQFRTKAALRVYRWCNTSLFYMGQPLTAAASIVSPFVINRHEAANNWVGLLLNSVLSFLLVYWLTKWGKRKTREHLIERGHFDIEHDRPTL